MHLSPDTLAQINTPALLLDLDRFDANIAAMDDFAGQHGIMVEPHAKTLRSTALLKTIDAHNFNGWAVAKLDHAEIMIKAGLELIFIANMIVGESDIRRLLELKKRAPFLYVGVDNLAVAQIMSKIFSEVKRICDVIIKIDTGLHRCGIQPKDLIKFAQVLKALPGVTNQGVYTHAGHAYKAASADIPTIGYEEGNIIAQAANDLHAAGLDCAIASVGSTPTAKYAGTIKGVTLIRPGLFMVNDRVQVALGQCTWDQCALFVLATVISKPTARRAYIDAGSQAFSADTGPHGTRRVKGFGTIIGHDDIQLNNLSEEHGWLTGPGVAKLKIGDKLVIIPNHACATTNLHDEIIGIRNDEIENRFPIDARGAIH